MRAGRVFLHRLIDLSTRATRLDHFIRLNAEAKADVEWWYQFIGPWNGVALLTGFAAQPPYSRMPQDRGIVEQSAELTGSSLSGRHGRSVTTFKSKN